MIFVGLATNFAWQLEDLILGKIILIVCKPVHNWNTNFSDNGMRC